jgi:photosystem II stability/assembly factor-like uncharacterized protein
MYFRGTTYLFIFSAGLFFLAQCNQPPTSPPPPVVPSEIEAVPSFSFHLPNLTGILPVEGSNQIFTIGDRGEKISGDSHFFPVLLVGTQKPTPFSPALYAIAENGQKNILTVGGEGVVYFYDSLRLPSFLQENRTGVLPAHTNLKALWGNPDARSDEYFGAGEQGSIYHITQRGWEWVKEADHQFSTHFLGVSGHGYQMTLRVVFVGTQGTIVERIDDTHFQKLDLSGFPSLSQLDFYGVWINPDGNHEWYIVGEKGTILHYENNILTQEILPPVYHNRPLSQFTFRAIQGQNNEIWVVGDHGIILQKKNGTWKFLLEEATQETLTAISMQKSPAIAYIVGQNGAFLSSLL